MRAEKKNSQGIILSYDEALEEVREYLQKKIGHDMEQKRKLKEERNSRKKNKQYLMEKKKKYREYITDCIMIKNIRVRNYQIEDFIEEMVSELAGYSVLEEAFNDPSVSNIYVIKWNVIFIKKNEENIKYHKTFRSSSHFSDVLERFLNEANETLNLGDSKRTSFELYGDRYYATSTGVTPAGCSLTIRKHTGINITRNQLIKTNVMDKKLADLLGLLILGGTNMICAGLVDSGKTTTLRALLDYHLKRANRRVIVNEDTQELFLKNEHTLEFVSVESDKPQNAVSLQDLVYSSLRLSPQHIVIGEVRGLEAGAAVEGMETGNPTIFSMHGATSWNIINRLVTKYLMTMPNLGIDVVERIIGSAVDYIFIQDNIPGIGRKITSLTEVSYDFKDRRVITKTICQFDFETKTWKWENLLGDEKTSKMLRRGIPLEKLKPWME